MADTVRTTLGAELCNWCRGEGINSTHAILLTRVPEEADISLIEETLQQIKALDRVQVRGKTYKPELDCIMVLCECRERVESDTIPFDVIPVSGGDAWGITTAGDERNIPESFSEKLSKLLREKGKILDDIHSPLAPNLTSGNSPKSIIRAVGELLERTAKPSTESSAYRHLRTLSGVSPTPAGDENLESWSEKARLMVEECDCSIKEKRRKIVDSLKGPALELIQAVRLTNPNASPMDYIEALESAFGTTESGVF
ncbi:paraneoplastic antigen Ma1 homolog [Myxocyprinus asiaticus]|uniref:paraneoplastic antigen Ma1 homolog n=1 Tax=Myxocyprinus asiaticus TaxID=70543 RepID=UPI002222CDC5|nr:paraneoplastic antigen Ma1 homolog [Myxocyprinus asiaticus]